MNQSDPQREQRAFFDADDDDDETEMKLSLGIFRTDSSQSSSPFRSVSSYNVFSNDRSEFWPAKIPRRRGRVDQIGQ